jgi:predicted ribosome-associated RNA-binding protein Tma20
MEQGMEQLVGKITHYFPKIGVAVVKLSANLRQGDEILVKGTHATFRQMVTSMQVEHANISQAAPGQEIGMKVSQLVHVGDQVYRSLTK